MPLAKGLAAAALPLRAVCGDDRTYVDDVDAFWIETHGNHTGSLASVEQTMLSEIGIFEPRRSSIDDLQRRLRRFLKTGGECCGKDFERLWPIKACAADRWGKTTATVLCRAVGAFRQNVEGSLGARHSDGAHGMCDRQD